MWRFFCCCFKIDKNKIKILHIKFGLIIIIFFFPQLKELGTRLEYRSCIRETTSYIFNTQMLCTQPNLEIKREHSQLMAHGHGVQLILKVHEINHTHTGSVNSRV